MSMAKSQQYLLQRYTAHMGHAKICCGEKNCATNIKDVANELQQYQTDLILLYKCCNIFFAAKV